jgi:8-oxo-dGTP pyrophosphatase MutT (NUDIX family)
MAIACDRAERIQHGSVRVGQSAHPNVKNCPCSRIATITSVMWTSPPKSAAREAYEEAGIRGTVGAKAIGVFCYEKGFDADGVIVPCEVRVFPMIVKRQLDTWPEADEREARWFEPAKALSAIKDRGLCELIESFFSRKSHKRPKRQGEVSH